MGDSEEKDYKKFLLQRNVLDMLRVYLEISDTFLACLKDHGLLTDDELDIVKTLGWPSNRNELLQMLIRKPWNKQKFDQFCVILVDTQTEQLTDIILTKVKDEFEDKEDPAKKQMQEQMEVYINDVDEKLGGLTLQAKNYIRTLLSERDERIRLLSVENQELRGQLKSQSDNLHSLHLKHQNLDKVMTDTMAAISFESIPPTLEAGMAVLKQNLDERREAIVRLEEEKSQMKKVEQDLRSKMTFLTEEHMRISSKCKALEEELVESKTGAKSKISDLEGNLENYKKKVVHLQSKQKTSDMVYEEKTKNLEREVRVLKDLLKETEMQLKEADQERVRANEELLELRDRTRKLLTSLGLTNDCNTLGLALDHARNISYVKRRRGSQMASGSELPIANLSGELGLFQGSEVKESGVESIEGTSAGSSHKNEKLLRRGSAMLEHGFSPSIKREVYSDINVTPRGSRRGSGPKDDKVFRRGSLTLEQGMISSPRISQQFACAEKREGLEHVETSKHQNSVISNTKINMCSVCDKEYDENSNFEGACMHHAVGAVRLHVGTEVEVWSCCKSRDTYRGCLKARHMAK